MAEEPLPPPLEIPWKLASTTQPLVAGEPEETALSLFFFEPDDEQLTSTFPGERLVFMKFTASISPAAFAPTTPPVAAGALGEGAPCLHMLLDLKVRRESDELGTIRPYFHSAAPLHRRIVQTGIVGNDVFEGEADGQFVGKSGTELHEMSRTSSGTTSSSAGATLGILRGSRRSTSTDVTADRTFDQTIDTTTREASQERRELLSHQTKIENVLTLLNAKYIGSPHLSFSLSPQPLRLLSIDPADPSLWFSQLLERRSMGLEGIQEFTMIVVVPKDVEFCVNARLRRVCVLDVPPGPLTFEEPMSLGLHLGRMLDYLDRVYPAGTPLDEFDDQVDLIGALPPPDNFTRPVLEQWVVGPQVALAAVLSPTPLPAPGFVRRATVNYKPWLEVWLDTQRDEYEREVARSPLERGVLLGEDRLLDTCFGLAEGGGLVVSFSSASVSPLLVFDVNPAAIDIGGVTADASSVRAGVRERAYEAVTRWNLLQSRLGVLLANRRKSKDKPFRLDDRRIVGILIEAWSSMRADDPRNVGFTTATRLLHLNDRHRGLLKAAGATDLRTVAQALEDAATIGRYNVRIELHQARHKDEGGEPPAGGPIKAAISAKDNVEMRAAIGAGLQKETTKSQSDT